MTAGQDRPSLALPVIVGALTTAVCVLIAIAAAVLLMAPV